MKKFSKTLIIIFVLFALLIGAVAIIRFFTPEDNWICVNSEWIRHGNPSSPQPGTSCGEEQPSVPVETKKEKNAKVFFSNSQKDPGALDCGLVFPVKRPLYMSGAFNEETIKNNLELLFAGPTDEEKKDGFFTSLNKDVKINKVFISDSSLRVDFDKKLEEGAAGSCKVSAIRAQLENTLKQYDKNVVISIDGRVDDILQP